MNETVIQRRFLARPARTENEILGAQRLRYRAFLGARGADPQGDARDADDHDAACSHFLIEDRRTQALVATFRLQRFTGGREIGRGYSAQFYSLNALQKIDRPIIELGRFCIDPSLGLQPTAEILRVAWGVLTEIVDDARAAMIIGCSSFRGTDAHAYREAFALLRDAHLAPPQFRPGVKSPDVIRFAAQQGRVEDRVVALRAMPPLLRSYLGLGGWVSDHAVIDRRMNTLHVFTGLEIERVPPGRARILRAAARQDH